MLIIFLFIFSIYLSFKLKFKNYKLNIKKIIKQDKTSLFLTLGTKIGVGSLIGTTSSILIGGFSSVIWMIIFSFLSTSLIYFETYYGIKYRIKNNDNYIGGPYNILKYGLNKKVLSYISIILLIIIYSFLFQMIQMNTIGYVLELLKIKKITILIITIIILYLTFSLSIKEILSSLNKIVPFMCIIFFAVSIYGIISNIDKINFNIFINDITNLKSIITGLIIGVKRSIFTNEILIGTTSITCASDKNDVNTCINYQILSVYFIGIIITIIVTLLILIYLSLNVKTNNYNQVIIDTYSIVLNDYGIFFILVLYILFGSTTILSGYYIGKSNIEYITNKKSIYILYKIIFILFAIFGVIIKNDFLWKITDILIFIMIIINSYSIILLCRSEK